MGELLQFPEVVKDPMEPLNESVVKPSVWARILANEGIENPTVELGSD